MSDYKNLHVLDHPLVSEKVHELRTMKTKSDDFDRIMTFLGVILGYEASRARRSISDQVMLVPILRTGLIMLDPMLTLFSNAVIGGLGFFANPKTGLPKLYHSDIRDSLEKKDIYILDPVVATGQTVQAAVEYLKSHGGNRISCLHILGTRAGIDRLCTAHPDTEVYLAQLNQGPDHEGQLMPGSKTDR